MKQPPFIAVEGPIGVGKTSLAQAIASHFHIPLVEEIAEANPFLGKFYDNMEDWSFQTEMFFLCNRFKQLEDIRDRFLLKNKAVVSDYHIFKNRIFATRTLKSAHYEKYMQIYHLLTDDLPRPNRVIYLTANLNTLLHRIQIRNRKVEKNLDPDYLERLIADYETFIDQFEREHPDIPVLHFNGDELDFVRSEIDLQHILTQLDDILEG